LCFPFCARYFAEAVGPVGDLDSGRGCSGAFCLAIWAAVGVVDMAEEGLVGLAAAAAEGDLVDLAVGVLAAAGPVAVGKGLVPRVRCVTHVFADAGKLHRSFASLRMTDQSE
jgi:hypothetical protein